MRRFVPAVALWLCLMPLLASADDEQPPAVFDGRSLANWMTLDGQPAAGGWEVVDGMIHLNTQHGRSGHIVTRDEYGDFTLTFDWKIEAGGNSGLKYRVRQYGKKTLGCEYQIYDDTGARKELPPNKSAGSLYDLYPPNAAKCLNPPGQFNTAKIVVRGDHLEHWLNGRLIVCATVGSEDWQRRLAESKFSDVADFAVGSGGRIMLTDHGSEVWYRNLTLTQHKCGSP